MNSNRLPSISVLLYVYNEKRNLERLLPSLKKTTYPKTLVEYIAVDDGSNDGTTKLLKDFGAKIISVSTRDIELNKGIAMHVAKNELIYWLDADMEICDEHFWQEMAKPLVVNKNLIGSFTNEFSLDGGPEVKNSLLRYLSHDELQRDPVYQFFSPSIKETIVCAEDDHFVCKFFPNKIPPVGRIMYRRKELLNTPVGKNKAYIDLESTAIVTRSGYQLFAYVPKAKIRHYHASTLFVLVEKRLRNLNRDFLPNIDHKLYTWFDVTNPKDVMKIVVWIIYANIFVLALIRGIWLAIKKWDAAFLWEPVVTIVTTDAILWEFISKEKGRALIFKIFSK